LYVGKRFVTMREEKRREEKRREETVWQQVCVFCKHFVKVRTPSLNL
jgi:hypothetical protein